MIISTLFYIQPFSQLPNTLSIIYDHLGKATHALFHFITRAPLTKGALSEVCCPPDLPCHQPPPSSSPFTQSNPPPCPSNWIFEAHYDDDDRSSIGLNFHLNHNNSETCSKCGHHHILRISHTVSLSRGSVRSNQNNPKRSLPPPSPLMWLVG